MDAPQRRALLTVELFTVVRLNKPAVVVDDSGVLTVGKSLGATGQEICRAAIVQGDPSLCFDEPHATPAAWVKSILSSFNAECERFSSLRRFGLDVRRNARRP